MSRVVWVGLLACVAQGSAAEQQKHNARDYEYFERKIRPLLSARCYKCHSSQSKPLHAGLRMDSAAGLRQGGESGALIVPGKPAESLLLKAVRYDEDLQMPPKGKLPAAEIAELAAWIKRGAPIPPDAHPTSRPSGSIDFAEGRKFWSFQPLRKQSLPVTKNSDWARNRLDTFILAGIERAGLKPSPEADRTTLIRRLTFDLTGLPPTPDQVRRFLDDRSPRAYEKLVEELLDSPQYGQKWARMWLDMARYTDKTASWLYKTGQAHFYRDWVIQAFNADMPYPEFIHRQLATDLMPKTGPDDLPALGFLSLSPTYWKELQLPCEIIKVIVADEWEERVDAVSRTFLGLTVACARCHDHKFDPISSRDYYALAGVFASCRQIDRPLISEKAYEPVRKAKAQVAKWQAEIAKLKKAKPQPKDKIAALTKSIAQLKSSTSHYDTPMANAVSEESLFVVRAGKTSQNGTKLEYRAEPRDLPVFVRGNPNRPGPVVQRRFLQVLSRSDTPSAFKQGSGRLELAEAITRDAAPLAARVLVNRIWLAHFGRGLVDTPSNFGKQGSRPSHPHLLDDLAARFVAEGWSIKNLHREILCSATWRQISSSPDSARDPGNVWLSRMNRRRLEFESWRDAMLAVSGRLDLKFGGAAQKLDQATNRRRTIYGTVHRREMSTTLQVHDFPDPTQHSPQRSKTITPLQGLYALNGPLLANEARELVARLQHDFPNERAARIQSAYRLLFNRSASARELKLGLTFLSTPDPKRLQELWQQYAHVLLASNEFLFVD